ncbi:helix-turn-helix domain-containing protein [Aureimonas populi]|uniref:Helix-turn-helix domain-containing protein n=1 Tax=Aureimonas populi TaxID=1701758 RepID=A0ABW5CNB7_9HYPH|nr:helix-turn-helix transcriptional regulator [Aureimonas populi]
MDTKKRPDEADKFIAKRVRDRRRELGLSQEKLGERLEITFQQVQKYENGKNRISAGRLFSISEFLLVPVSYFYEGLGSSDRANGFAETDEQDPFVPPPPAETEELMRYFSRLPDAAVRRSIVDFVRTLAEREEKSLPRE